MSSNDEKEVAIIEEGQAIPPQTSPTDTSNQDNKVSVDPSGEKYIRSLDDADAA